MGDCKESPDVPQGIVIVPESNGINKTMVSANLAKGFYKSNLAVAGEK